MKKGVVFSVSLALVLAFCVPAFAQPNVKSVETISIDDFDTEKEFAWKVQASRFVADGFPKQQYVEAIPNALRAIYEKEEPAKVLGVNISYNRKGENWFEIFPSKAGENGESAAYEIPFKGLVDHVDFWVWGANYKYTLEMMVRDVYGIVYVLPVCQLNFNGWKNVVVNIPKTIHQTARLRTAPSSMKFVGFRVRTDPDEYVDDFNIFFDQLQYTTHVLSNIYDGFDLNHFSFEESSSNTSEEGK